MPVCPVVPLAPVVRGTVSIYPLGSTPSRARGWGLAPVLRRRRGWEDRCVTAVTLYGLCALTFMMAMYALERRGPRFVVAFAIGCLLSSAYGFWSGAWPFGVVEIVWCGVALRRLRSVAPPAGGGPQAER